MFFFYSVSFEEIRYVMFYITHTYIFRIITMILQLNVIACIIYMILQLLFTKLSKYPIRMNHRYDGLYKYISLSFICFHWLILIIH